MNGNLIIVSQLRLVCLAITLTRSTSSAPDSLDHSSALSLHVIEIRTPLPERFTNTHIQQGKSYISSMSTLTDRVVKVFSSAPVQLLSIHVEVYIIQVKVETYF